MRCKGNCESHRYCVWDGPSSSCSTDVASLPASCTLQSSAQNPPLAPINLLSAANFVIFAETAITTTGTTDITGALGISPNDFSSITGFALAMHTSNVYSTSTYVTGRIYSPTYASPTPTTVNQAMLDSRTAYTEAANRVNPDHTGLGGGDIGGMTLYGGLYEWTTDVLANTDVTLSGCANDVFIFSSTGRFLLGSSTNIILAGGVLPGNVFWQFAGGATIGTGAHVKGNILSQTDIVFQTGSSGVGRALAQTQVTLDATTLVRPGL
jgi:hypothetical protein